MEKEKAKIRAYNGIFINSKAIFVEYIDIIKSPYFMIVVAIAALGKKLPSPFDISPILESEIDDLIEWYYQRTNQNPLLDLLEDDARGRIKLKDIGNFLNNQITEEILKATNELNFVDVLNRLYIMNPELAGSVFIWYPYENSYIDNDIKLTLNAIDDLVILHGPIEDALKKVPEDATFVFSDVSNINALEEVGKLDYSSILIPIEYVYNYVDGEYLINFDKLAEDHIFKLDKFMASIEPNDESAIPEDMEVDEYDPMDEEIEEDNEEVQRE